MIRVPYTALCGESPWTPAGHVRRRTAERYAHSSKRSPPSTSAATQRSRHVTSNLRVRTLACIRVEWRLAMVVRILLALVTCTVLGGCWRHGGARYDDHHDDHHGDRRADVRHDR